MVAPAALRPSLGAACRAASTGLRITTRTTDPRSPPALQAAGFSTTSLLFKRHTYEGARDNKDHNRKRGESALRRTGTRWKLSVSDEPLPKPAKNDRIPVPETNPEHGLWEFFENRTTVVNGVIDETKHGRSWTVEELRAKSWEDLHKLWWVCVKERNRLATSLYELEHQKLGMGDIDINTRDEVVRFTMRAIKHVLTERQYAWEDAVQIAMEDPEINLNATGKEAVYTPFKYMVDEPVAANEPQPEEAAKEDIMRTLAEGALADREKANTAAAGETESATPSEQKETPRI